MKTMTAPGGTDSALPGKDRAFRRLLAASTVSMLGSHMTSIAYPMLVLRLTGSPVISGWVAFAAIAPSILVYVPAGALVDRWDPRRAMLLSEFGRGIAIGVVAATIALQVTNVPLLIVAAVIEGMLEVFSTLAERRNVGMLVERDQISSALVRVEARAHVVLVVGRPLGGFLFGIQAIFPFLADVASFIYSVVTLLRFKGGPALTQRTRSHYSKRLGSDIRMGLRWLRAHPFAYMAILVFATGTLIFQALMMIFLADARAARLSAFSVGLVLAASGLGGTLGSVAASRLLTRVGYSWIKLQALTWLIGFAVLAISAGRQFLLIAIVMAILGLTGALGNIELDVYFMQNVNQDMLARVTSVSRLASLSACALGPALGGVLVQVLGVPHALYCLCGISPLLLLLSLVMPSARMTRDQPVILDELLTEGS
jgi:MFS family permease